ncbi:MAG: DegV family protein [Woeseia sp.]
MARPEVLMTAMAPPILHLAADNFADALRSGIHRVIGEQEALNSINVFPVADGDTGTNLSLTLGAALAVLKNPGKSQLSLLLASMADVMLDNARGNSGAIMAQFFQGMSDGAEQLPRFSAQSFARSVTNGYDYAHDALSEPCEGTILSVISAFAASLQKQTAAAGTVAFGELLQNALPPCREALTRTQSQLEALRRAGVVDAGAKGFVSLIEGMNDWLSHGQATPRPEMGSLGEHLIATVIADSGSNTQYRYCTECVVSGGQIDRRKLREALSAIGDSLVLAGTKRKARIHIHADDPDEVFRIARRFGELGAEKADDMHQQLRSTHGPRPHFAVITDSAADIDDADLEELDIHMVPLRIQFGDRGYLDKVSISADEFFSELAGNPHHPTTSQPAPGDFRRQFQFLASHFPDVISINLTGSVSGTLQAARSAAERIRAKGQVHVLNSLNASLGQGLIAVFAAECAAAGLDAQSALRAIEAVIPETYSFGLVKDLRYAVRGGRVPGTRKIVADILRITPVLRSEADGRISAGGMLVGRRNLLPKFSRYIAGRLADNSEWRVAIGHAQCRDEAEQLGTLLKERIPGIVRYRVTELGSALGAHGGPGTIVVGVQRFRTPGEF